MKFSKISKKAISVVVALAIVLSCITVSLSVFAAVSPFVVTKGSPALPIYVGRTINLSNVQVELGNTKKTASSLTWTKKSGSSAKIEGTTLSGLSKGNTCFNVSDGTNKQNVWVLVNDPGDKDFKLIDVDFGNSATYTKSEWVGLASAAWSSTNLYTSGATFKRNASSVAYKTNVATKNDGTRGALYVGAIGDNGGTKGVVYTGTALDDFGDYSIDADMSYVIASKSPSANDNMISAAGVMARVSLDPSATADGNLFLSDTEKSIHFRMRNYGGLMISAYNQLAETPAGNYLANDACYSYFNGNVTADDLWIGGDKSKVFYPDVMESPNPTVRNVVISLSGNDIKYSIDGSTILDTENGTIKSMFVPVNDAPGTDSSAASSNNVNTLKNQAYSGKYTAGPSFTHAQYDAAFNQNVKAKKGTIGFTMNFGGDVYVYSVKVRPNNFTADTMPLMDGDEEPVDYDIPINTKYNLSAFGQSIVWNNIRTAEYEVNGGMLLVYAMPKKGIITVTGKDGNNAVSKTFDVLEKGEDTDLEVIKFADDEMTVIPYTNFDNTYKVRIDPSKEVVHGTINLNEGTQNSMVYQTAVDTTAGTEFEFSSYNPSAMILTASYITREAGEASIYNLGSTVRLTQHGDSAATRYYVRIPAITKSAGGADLATTIKVNGSNVTPLQVGTLFIPTVILNGADLKFPDNYTSGVFYINNCPVQNVVINKLIKATDKYSDAYATISGFGSEASYKFNPLDVDITAVSYIKYNNDGKIGYIYSNDKSDSYNEILDRAFPLQVNDSNISAAITGATSNEIDANNASNALTYLVGEDITFSYNISGAYSLDWKLCKDEPANNLYGDEAYDGNSELVVASGKTQAGEHVFTLTTQMKRAGTLKLVASIVDSYGKTVKFDNGKEATFVTVAAAGVGDIVQPLEVSGKATSDTNLVLGNAVDTFDARFSVVSKALTDNKDAVKTFLTSATASQSKTFGSVLKLTCSSVSGGYRYFDYVIAINDKVGFTTNFSDTVYSTAASSTGIKAYNLRPSTGCFAIPTTATSLTSIVANFADGNAAGAHSGGTAKTIVINANMHGYDNASAVSNPSTITTLAGKVPTAGGIKDCFTSSTEKSATKVENSYAYGVIYRDYIALQTAKKLFKILMGSGASSVTTAGSTLGGWQSLEVSALDKQLTETKADLPYMASLGACANVLDGLVQPDGVALRYFSAASAAQRIASTMNARPNNYKVTLTGNLADTVSPANGVLSIYAALDSANCNKSITMKQFTEHDGSAPFASNKCYTSTLSGKYDSFEGRKPIDTSDDVDPVDPGDVPVGGTSPTRSTVVVGGDSVPSSLRGEFKVPTNLMTTEQYHTKLDTLRTSGTDLTNASTQFLGELDKIDLMLQDSIVYNTDDLVNKSGYTKKFYVSSSTGNDNNSGTSPEKAWKTLKKVNTMRNSMGSGTLVSFKRGDTFRGIIQPVSGVHYGAYGVGYKPIIKSSYSVKENGWKWVATSYDNIWKLNHKFTEETGSTYGCSNFSTGNLTHDLSLATLIDKQGNQYAVYKEKFIASLNSYHNGSHGESVPNTHLSHEYCYTGTDYNAFNNNIDSSFGTKPGDNEMYLYCEGNPNELFDDAEIGWWTSNFNEDNAYTHDIHINNIEMLYGTGSYWPGACNNTVVDYCIAGWQGGFMGLGGKSFDATPYTGGVGSSIACDGLTYDHCYIFQQWDSGTSIQTKTGSRDPYGGSGDTVFKDFITTNCVIKGTKWSLEAWLAVNGTTTDVIDHMVFDYNLVRDTGWGFNCYQPWESACIETWGYPNDYVNNCSISHNVFDRPNGRIYRNGAFTQTADNVYTFDSSKFPANDYNILIQEKGKEFALIKRMADKQHYTADHKLMYNEQGVNLLRNTYGLDKHSLCVFATR